MRNSEFHGKKFALLVELPQRQLVVTGIATYDAQWSPDGALRIELEDEGDGIPEFVLEGYAWQEWLDSGQQYNCDYTLTLTPRLAASCNSLRECA